MAKTLLTINSTDINGKKKSKTMNFINAAATNAQLEGFASLLYGLTTNTYIDSERIDKQSTSEQGLHIDTSHCDAVLSVIDIAGGKRISLGNDNYIDVNF